MAKENTLDYYLKIAWQSVANTYNREAALFDLTQATGYVLINIRREGTSVSQIASLLGVRSTSLSRMLKSMETQGLIKRVADSTDKRSVKVYLTDKGIEKRERAKQVVRNFNSFLDEHFTRTERSRLIDLLLRIQRLARDYRADEPGDKK